MPRQARVILPGCVHHILQRGHNSTPCFRTDQDYQLYLSWLEECAESVECRVHAFVLMPNHVHLLVTPNNLWGCGDMMRRLGQRYTQYANQKYRRTGALWEGRYRSCIVCERDFILRCYNYIEDNPVRAGYVEHPEDYPWTSYRINALGEESSLVAQDDVYHSLGDSVEERRAQYQILTGKPLNEAELEEFRRNTNGNRAAGTQTIKQHLESRLGRRMVMGRPGRPADA